MNVVFNCIDLLISIYILIIHLIEFYDQSQVERLVYGTLINGSINRTEYVNVAMKSKALLNLVCILKMFLKYLKC